MRTSRTHQASTETAPKRSSGGPIKPHVLQPKGTRRVPRTRPALTLVAPIYNEVDNLRLLVERVSAALLPLGEWELLLVDDGSDDGSWDLIDELAQRDDRIRGMRMDRNRGQSTAIWAGISKARADLVATMDADLQQDPVDLMAMLERLHADNGVDAVVGYRTSREDNWARRVSSKAANAIRNRVSRDQIRDSGCSLKVFRRAAIQSLVPFDGMHRFLPTLLRHRGHHVVEHPVSHFPRIYGKSKYGVRNRAAAAFVDLLAVRWMRNRLIDPSVLQRVKD